jgi:hypothetical protein
MSEWSIEQREREYVNVVGVALADAALGLSERSTTDWRRPALQPLPKPIRQSHFIAHDVSLLGRERDVRDNSAA